MHSLRKWALPGALLVAAAACNTDRLAIPNYNAPTVAGVATDPNGIQLLVTGIQSGQRGGHGGWVSDAGVFGRESYNYFPTDGRTVSNYLIGVLNPQRLERAGFASGNWTGPYQNMKNEVNLITAANASALATDKKNGVIGFAKTMRAYDLYIIAASRDSLGGPTEIAADPSTPAPFVSRDSMFRAITGLLDEGKTALLGAGTSFSFQLTAGFAGFDTPAGFLKFNRALKARVEVIRGSQGCGATCYTTALTALGESFVTPVGAAASQSALDVGPQHLYSAASGDAQNPLSFAVQNYRFAHKSVVTDAQKQADGVTLDDRVLRKVTALAVPVSPPGGINIAAEYRFLMYATNSTPASIIRNEELILLRAEANIATGNTASALADLNNIRAVSGKLPPIAVANLDALMYEKRMSTLNEGLRWVDMRRWGRLAQLPIDKAGQFVAKVMPIPQAECDARLSAPPNGCLANQ
jgi:hypothetical protein